MPAPPPIPSDPRTLEDLRSILRRNADAMQAALGSPPHMLAVIDAVVYERRLRDASTDVAALARLFLLGQPVARARLERAVTPIALQALQDIGLVADRGDEIRPLVRVTLYEGILIVSDLADVSRSHDFVAGTSPAAQRVAELTMRVPARRALDLGTGSGLQALLAAAHCDRVVGVDLNGRALAMARLNASFNGVSNAEFREGSWLRLTGFSVHNRVRVRRPYK